MANDDVFANIPQEIIFQILTKLPSYTLIQLRCVSKSFNSLISHPDFLNLHLPSAAAVPHHHHLIYHESTDYINSYFSFHVENTFSLCKTIKTPFRSVNGYFRIVGSSRGVVCLFDTNYFASVGAAIIWNPFIGKFKILPSLLNLLRVNFSNMVVGFGFDHRTVDFKVVEILYSCDSEHEFLPKAYVYGLKTGSWRSIQLSVPCFMPKRWCSSVFVNGVVHWLAYKQKPGFNAQPNCIMGFDVVDEVFKSIELPRSLGANCRNIGLSHLVDEKSLALFVHCSENTVEKWDLWLMNAYGDVESWMKKYTIVIKEYFFPLEIVNGVDLLAATGDDKLVLIDLEKEESKDLDVCGLAPSFYTTSYEPSLALLDIGEQLVE